jgi:hypothetical protein
MAPIAGFGVVHVAALSLVRVPPLLSPFPRLLAVAAAVLPHQLYYYLLSLLLLSCLLPPVLTAKWSATSASIMFLLSVRVRRLSRGTARTQRAGSGSRRRHLLLFQN